MKKTIFYLTSFLVFGMVSCSENEDLVVQTTDQAESASLKITIAGDQVAQTRTVGDVSSGTNPAVENLISNFTVYVFDSSTMALEKTDSFTVSSSADYTQTLTGLSTGTKKHLVVYVNVPAGADFSPSNSRYSDLNANLLTLDSQNANDLNSVGLFMSGESESPIEIKSAETVAVSVKVKRRVAKLALTSLVVDVTGAASDYLKNFTLTGVSVQKARQTGTPIGGLVQPTGTPSEIYAGGLATDSLSAYRDYLKELIKVDFSAYTMGANIITEATDEKYFYVLPNNNTSDNGTLMTIYGEYNGTKVYFPFLVNSGVIDSNNVYILRVTLKKLNIPSGDPNVIPSTGDLSVQIVPQDWALVLEQNVEW